MPSLSEPLTLLQAAAFTEWYEALAPRLKRWLEQRGVHTAAHAEDIVQETFIRVLGNIEHVSKLSEAHRQHWVFTVAARINVDNIRHAVTGQGAGVATPFSAFADAGSLPAEPVTASQDWIAHAQQVEQTTAARLSLKAAWDRIPVEMRELLLMVCYGYSYGEIATHFGITKGAVSMRMYHLRRMLRTVKEQVA